MTHLFVCNLPQSLIAVRRCFFLFTIMQWYHESSAVGFILQRFLQLNTFWDELLWWLFNEHSEEISAAIILFIHADTHSFVSYF